MRPPVYAPRKYFRLPDLSKGWPFPRTINPHHDQVAPVSSDWIDDFHAFTHKRRIAFKKANFGLLASLAYPHASPTHLRSACDLMNANFVLDDISDVQCAADVRKDAAIIMDAMR
jgi:Delta6-protoilludene synthase